MRRILGLLMLCLFLGTAGCTSRSKPEPTVSQTTDPLPTGSAVTEPATQATLPPIVLELTEKEKDMLMQIAMAEVGSDDCTECLALVMCTVLNRVEAPKFGNTIHEVLHTPDQFTPLSDGSYYFAQPNDQCEEALDLVMRGWDESQGALYYEFCEGKSWHSENLELLFQHCRTRFYK